MSDEGYAAYGRGTIEPGDHPAVIVVDYQRAFTTNGLGMGGSDLIERGVVNAGRLLRVARAEGVPVFQFVVAFGEAEGGLGLWSRKVPKLGEITADSPWVEVDERVWDPSDTLLRKKWPSVFAGTPLAALLNAQRIDTVIIVGCTTSGCVRASVVDAFSNGFLTLVPEDAVGDQEQGPHDANLLDCHRRYAEVTTVDACTGYLRGRSAA
ncbi:MAG: isochorismatase family protein [Actinomycetota bacterium]|nr:isochorismatase family protein [Actinomycetota bacterium]